MFTLQRLIVAILVTAGGAAVRAETPWLDAAKAARALPSEVFFSSPDVRQPRVSPDGTKIAFLFPHEGKMVLGLFDRKTGEASMILEGREESLFSFFWKGDDRIVFSADYQGNESFFVGSTDLKGRRVVRILETQRYDTLMGSAGGVVSSLRHDKNRIIVSGVFRAAGTMDRSSLPDGTVIARINVRNRGIAPIYTYDNRLQYSDAITDQQGHVRFRVTHENVDGVMVNNIEHRPDDNSAWEDVTHFPMNPYAETWEPLYFNRDGRFLYILSREENDRGALHALDTDTMEVGPPLFVPPEGEIVSVVTSMDGYSLRGVVYESDKRYYHWFEEGKDRGKLQASIEAAFPGMEVTFTSFSDDENVALIHVGSDREVGVYFVLDRKAGSLTQFKRVREVPASLMRPMEPIQYTARDGLEIHGYITRPWSAESGRPVPMIVNPHGGPFGVRDSWGFNSEVQFLASRGYAVLQINYRGSGGYGRDFLEKGARQWGRDMQDDLTDGVKWAIAEGIADPDRIAIYGASYGGYATLAGLIFTPELYACGINYVGATDLELGFKAKGQDAFMTADSYDSRAIWVGETQEYRDATSPVNFVDRIQVPSFHAYGQKDPRVVIDHWERLEPELKKHGKIYESMVEKEQGHGFRDEQSSLGFYDRIEPFLEKYLTPEVDVQIGAVETVELPAR